MVDERKIKRGANLLGPEALIRAFSFDLFVSGPGELQAITIKAIRI